MGIIEAAGVTTAPTNYFFVEAAGVTNRLYKTVVGVAGDTSRIYKSICWGGLGTAPTNP